MDISATYLDTIQVPGSGAATSLLSRSDGTSSHEYGNIHGAIYGFGAVSLALTTLTTCMRIFTKFHIFKVRRWDDYLMIVSWAGLVCMWAFIFVSVNYGAGDHIQDTYVSEFSDFMKYAFLHGLFYAVIQCLLKTSIALQILHIFVPNLTIRSNKDRKFWMIVIFTVLQNIWFIIFFWISLFQCDPVRKEFDYTVSGHCMKGWNAYNVVVSAWNMTSDILMLLFPIICIWQLKMRLAFKVEAGGVFFVGALAVAASLLRLVFTIRYFYTTDYTLVLTQIALCDTGEITAGMVVGNFVPFPRFVAYVYDHVRAAITGEKLQCKGSVQSDNMFPFPMRDSDGNGNGQGQCQETQRNDSIVSDMFSFEELMNASRVQRPA